LTSIDNIPNEAYHIASNGAIFQFFNVEFVCSVDKRLPLSMAQERSLEREGSENIK